jgi:probable phosphoglycerate mutase
MMMMASGNNNKINNVKSDVFLVNFDEEELMHLQDLLKEMKEEYGLERDVNAVIVNESNWFLTVDGAETNEATSTTTTVKPPYPESCRCVLLNGDNAKRLMPELKEAMIDMGFQPSIFGTFTEKNNDKSIANCARQVISAHERYWKLRGTEDDLIDGSDDDSTDDLISTSWPDGEDGISIFNPGSVSIAMSLALDRADVGSSTSVGGIRSDASKIVVLDNVVCDPLRRDLLKEMCGNQETNGFDAWIDSEPPEGLWSRDTYDTLDTGSPSTSGSSLESAEAKNTSSWGLTEDQLAKVARSSAVKTLRARIQRLYPEYEVLPMSADSLEPEGIPGSWGGLRIKTAVGNAAVNGEDFSWHLDMDPSSVDPTSPWAERFGLYVNRERNKPLFVSALVYLNPNVWPASYDAETMFLDPGTGTGVFVRPQPGRLVLMDQDVVHRVSAPSKAAGVPRYSLVLKLVFHPKVTIPTNTNTDAAGNDDDDDDFNDLDGITRKEWGEPVLFGSAAGFDLDADDCSSSDEDDYEDEFGDDCDPYEEDCEGNENFYKSV